MPSTYAFIAGTSGEWRIRLIAGYLGESLDPAQKLDMRPVEPGMQKAAATWRLLGTVSNVRYATQAEVVSLRRRQEPLQRPQASRAALIPTRTSPGWLSGTPTRRRERPR